MSPFITVRELLSNGCEALASTPSPRLDAEVLLGHTLGQPRAWLYAHGDDTPDATARARFETLLARRAAGEPVPYLTGQREFWNLDLHVSDATLIPRPDTETLVEAALQRLQGRSAPQVADLGTGSGAIALALASERPDAQLVATDVEPAALDVAQANAKRLGLSNVRFVQGDWLDALPGRMRFDMLVSNPPYVALGDPHLADGDVRFEPASALVSGTDGLDAIRMLAASAASRLLAGGWLLLEHGYDQGDAVRALLERAGFTAVTTRTDLAGRDRVTLGTLPRANVGDDAT